MNVIKNILTQKPLFFNDFKAILKKCSFCLTYMDRSYKEARVNTEEIEIYKLTHI